MRYRPIQAALRERAPSKLWGRSTARTVLAAVAASAAALVPAVMGASPAQAASTYISITPTTATVAEGNTASFTLTALGGSANGLGATYTIAVTGSGTASGSDYGTLSATAFDWNNTTEAVTLPILADQVVDGGETVVLRATNDGDPNDFVQATITIADVGFTLTAPPVSETVVTPAVGNTPAVQRTARVTATLTGPVNYQVTIPLTVGQNGDTALSSAQATNQNINQAYRDYDTPGGSPSISIPAGQISGYYDVTLFDDSLDEDDVQYFTVITPTANRVGASPVGGLASGGTVRVNILDDDATPTVQIGGAGSVTEGNTLGFPITLSAPSERDVTVTVNTANGVTGGNSYGATAPGDYTALTNQTVTIPHYSTSASALVTTLTDSAIEASPETLTATISNPVNATLGATTTAQGGINDANPAPTLDVSTSALALNQSSFASEGNSGETAGALTFTLSTASTIPVIINYTFGGGTATLGTDYRATSGSLTIPAGSTTATVPVSIVGDTIYEPGGETFNVTLSSPNSSVDFGGHAVRTFTIADDDAVAPSYSIANTSVTEGNSGTTMAQIPITLTGATNADVVFNVVATPGVGVTGAVEAGTNAGATSGADDYDNPASTVTVPAGSTTATISVPIKGDTVYEKDQTFTVAATPANGAQVTGVAAVTATVTILNDDAAPRMTFNETSGTEGTTIRALGTIVGVSEYPYTVSIAWAGQGTAPLAASADDYTLSNQIASPITVLRGSSGALANPIADIFINQDTIDEPTEQLGVTATETTNPLTGFATSVGVYRLGDDPSDVPPSASVHDVTVDEDQGTAAVTVDLAFNGDTTATTQTVTVPYSTQNGSAKAGEDYQATNGVLSFAPGETSKTISVPITNDHVAEGAENFYVKLGQPGPAGATVTNGTGEVTIRANSGVITPTISAPSSVTGPSTVTITGHTSPGVTVELWGAAWSPSNPALARLTTTTSAANGNYRFSRPISSGYRFQTAVSGVRSALVRVSVTQDPMLTVSSPSRGKLSISVQGDPKGSGQNLVVQRLSGGKWVNAWTGTTGSNGMWSKTVSEKSKSSWTLRAYVAGNSGMGINSGYSGSKKVTVK